MPQQVSHITISNPFAELGVDPDADESAIRHAFSKLAFELHPDRNSDPGAAEEFMRVRAAYEALTDPAWQEAREADLVVEAAANAADEADRRRAGRPRPTEVARITLQPPADVLGMFRLPPDRAARIAVGWFVITAVAIIVTGVSSVGAIGIVAALALVFAIASWATRSKPVALRIFGSGFRDQRWEMAGQIGWADVCWVEADHGLGTVDLELIQSVADRLAALPHRPKGILVWEAERAFYRLPLGEQFESGLKMFEARTGLQAR